MTETEFNHCLSIEVTQKQDNFRLGGKTTCLVKNIFLVRNL